MQEEIEHDNYQAYLLRLWRENKELPWRATLQNPHTQEQMGFATLEQLFMFLRAQTAETPAVDRQQGDS